MLAEELAEAGLSVVALHGAMPQTVRNRRLRSIREGRAKILVATDVAARGLDVPTISHVINFGLPMKNEDYVHRIGRTGRAGRTGKAITLATYRERGKIRALEDFLDARLNVSEIEGLEPSPPPARGSRDGGGRGRDGGGRGRDGGGRGRGGFGGRDGGGRARFEGESNFKRREGVMTVHVVATMTNLVVIVHHLVVKIVHVVNLIMIVHVVKAVSVIVHNVLLMTVQNVILVIVQRHVVKAVSVIVRNVLLMIVQSVNSTLIVHVAKAVSTISHVLTRMMTTAVTV